MAKYWLFLSDPETYHYDEVFKKKRELWDGVWGAAAQRYLAEIRPGDPIIGYHTAPEKSAYCQLEAVSVAYQNPEEKEKNLVVEVRGVKKFKRVVPLTEMKKNRKLKGMKLFKFFRPIAVSPLTPTEFRELKRLGGGKAGGRGRASA